MLAFTDWAIEILSRADAAARRFNPDARVRIVREAAGGVRFELTDEADPTDRVVEHPSGFTLLVEEGLEGTVDVIEPHDQLILRPGRHGTERAHDRPDLRGKSKMRPDTLAAMTEAGALRAVGGAGPVMIIGGAEDRFRDKVILGTFAELAGGADGTRRGDLHGFLAGRCRHAGLPRALPRPGDRTR